ncbi:hypothetical protein J5N97_003642 [Dioscorea zingiberensis]|uniref:COMM domain-containing protein n=1 Tax=Dioscorea zingiberensis TaxID=325984 RepID=A0A9D5D504_9LILI|nr:hypothetical protein J5N97_003642 [Dioscorea zingiberensis]
MGACEHLRKLSSSISEETLTYVLDTLWSTRRTGLSSSQKPLFQSLLGLPALQDLEPVLACLRSIIRKCVHENLAGDDIKKFLPVDLSTEFQTILLMLLQKYQNQWKDEALRDQPLWRHARLSHQVRVSSPPVVAPCTLSELSSKQLPWQENISAYHSLDDSILNYDVPSLPHGVADTNMYQSKGSVDAMGILPRLKSMTWSIQDRNLTPSNRMAVITLKLENYAKSPLSEIEVKFQISRDILEAMLRSLTHISEKLSNSVTQVQPSEPSLKKQRQ